MLSSALLNRISEVEVIPANETALFRVIRDSPGVFADWDRAVSLYLERSTSIDEDTATDAEKTWIYRSLVIWPSKHSNFVRDVIEILDDFDVSVSLPTGFSLLKVAIDNYIAAFYPDGSSVYWLFETEWPFAVRNTGGAAPDADAHPDNYDYGEDFSYNINVSFNAATPTALIKALNDLVWDVQQVNSSRYTATTALPLAVGTIVAKVYLIIKFLRETISDTYASGEYLNSTDYTALESAANGVLTL